MKEALIMRLFSEIELSNDDPVQERSPHLAMSTEDEPLPEHPMERPMPFEEEAEIESLEEEKREEKKREDSPSDH